MLILRALDLPDHLEEQLPDESVWQVCQRFDHGLNLSCGGALLFLSGPASPLCPFGVRLPEADAEHLLSGTEIGQRFTWTGDGLRRSGVYLRCTAARRVSLSQPSVPQLPGGLSRWLEEDGVPDSPCTEVLEEWSARLFQSFSGRTDHWENLLRACIGYGPGLTPAGDDFLVGLLWVHAWSPFVPARCLDDLRKCLFLRPSTTRTSLNYYRHALEGRFSQPLIRLGQAMTREDWREADRALLALLALGHTSGRDTWAGIRSSLRFLLSRT